HLTVKLETLNPERTARNRGGDSEGPGSDKTALGITVGPAKDGHGLVVRDVDPDGRAADAGIKSGDVIESVNRRSVTSVEELRAAIRQSSDKPALVLINRDGSNLFVTVRPANG